MVVEHLVFHIPVANPAFLVQVLKDSVVIKTYGFDRINCYDLESNVTARVLNIAHTSFAHENIILNYSIRVLGPDTDLEGYYDPENYTFKFYYK